VRDLETIDFELRLLAVVRLFPQTSTVADSRQIYDRRLVNLRPPRAHIYVLCPTVFASPSRTVSTELNRGLRKSPGCNYPCEE
jgi:hypothetical protein